MTSHVTSSDADLRLTAFTAVASQEDGGSYHFFCLFLSVVLDELSDIMFQTSRSEKFL